MARTLSITQVVLPLVAMAVVLGAVGGREARGAEPAAPAPAEVVAQAREHYQKGLAHFDLKEYAEALIEFKNAYRIVQDPPLLFNIAQCHRRLGQNAEALDFYRNFLRRSPRSSNRAEVERRIREIERELPTEAKPAPGLNAPEPRGGTTAGARPAAARPAAANVPANANGPKPAATAAGDMTSPQPPSAAAATSPPAASPTILAAPAPALDLRAGASPAAPPPRPFYKRWWFWTGIGALVAVLLIAGAASANRGEIGSCAGLSSCLTVEKGQ